MLLETITLASAGLVVYHHAGYPLLLKTLARLHKDERLDQPAAPGRRYQPRPDDGEQPTVAIIIPAYNEAAVIADKVRNLAIQDYPTEKLQVIIACDGCTDDTAERARAAASDPLCGDLNVTVRDFAENRGKLAVLNELIPQVDADIVALTDASALLSIDALSIAAHHFQDASVGAVCATYKMLTPGSAGEQTYWQYQVAIKQREAALGAPLGAHGACYLFRPSLFSPLAPDTINDDFILPMSIVAHGKRVVYDTRMIAVELEKATEAMDHRRRRRIGAGNMQQVIRLAPLLVPAPGRVGIAFAFISGKGLRPLVPALMLMAWVGSALLASGSIFFAIAAVGQTVLYGLAALRAVFPRLPWPRPISALTYLVSGHIAGIIGAVRYLAGLDRGGWRRVQNQ